MMYIYPYKSDSKSAELLAKELGIKRIRHENSIFKGSKNTIVINWGCGNRLPDEVMKCQVLNHYRAIERSINKLDYFNLLSRNGVSIPDYTTDLYTAKSWLRKNKGPVVCRQLLEGHEGKGIVIADRLNQLIDAPMYTLFIPQTDEYRINLHCLYGKPHTFFVQRKVKERGANNKWRVRNSDNGFVFSHKDIYPPRDVLNQALAAFVVSDLDFGAVDVVWNVEKEKAYVLEINTAPGIEGRMLREYANIFREMI